MYSRADFAAAALLTGLGALVIFAARRLPDGYDPLGPGFLPTCIGAGLIVLALALVLRAAGAVRRGESAFAEGFDAAGAARVGAATAVLAALVAAMTWTPGIGFPVLATAALFALSLLYGGGFRLGTLVFSVALGLGVYQLFHGWFKLPLPAPAWM